MRTVYLNGCFDELHLGHRFFFYKGKQYGDRLIVGIMPDDYIRQHKLREPWLDEITRATLVALDRSVNEAIVLPHDEISEIELITEIIRPDVFCLGVGQYDKPWNLHLKGILRMYNPAIEFVDIPKYHRDIYRSSLINKKATIK